MPKVCVCTCGNDSHTPVGIAPTVEVHAGWARIPKVVAADVRVSHAAVRVYVALALSERGGKCSIGLRRICDLSRVDMKTARAAISALVQLGYLKTKAGTNGNRSSYTLTDALFGATQKTVPVAESESLPKVVMDMVSCPVCHTRVRKLLKVGYCRSCNWARKVRGIVRDEIEKIA